MTMLIEKNKIGLPAMVTDFFETGKLFPDFLDLHGGIMDWKFPVQMPSVNILEKEKEFNLELAAPGFEKKDFKIELENGILHISVEKREEKKDEKENYHRREFSYRAFSRKFTLPENVLADKIDAKYENGILKLMLPKKEASVIKPK